MRQEGQGQENSPADAVDVTERVEVIRHSWNRKLTGTVLPIKGKVVDVFVLEGSTLIGGAMLVISHGDELWHGYVVEDCVASRLIKPLCIDGVVYFLVR